MAASTASGEWISAKLSVSLRVRFRIALSSRTVSSVKDVSTSRCLTSGAVPCAPVRRHGHLSAPRGPSSGPAPSGIPVRPHRLTGDVQPSSRGVVMTGILEPLAGTVPAEWEKLDDRFEGIRGDSRLERLWTGGRWTEGPVYSPAGRYLLWSDIPNDRIL